VIKVSIREYIKRRLGILKLSHSNNKSKIYKNVKGFGYYPETQELIIDYQVNYKHYKDHKDRCSIVWWSNKVETRLAEITDKRISVTFTEPYPKGEWSTEPRREFKIKPVV